MTGEAIALLGSAESAGGDEGSEALVEGTIDYSYRPHVAIDFRAPYVEDLLRPTAAPAYPGDTIRIELFATTEGVRFRARALERRVLVLERREIQLA